MRLSNYGVVLEKDEVQDALRSFDWSGTPLGRLEDWPESLREAAAGAIAKNVNNGGYCTNSNHNNINAQAKKAAKDIVHNSLLQTPFAVTILLGPEFIIDMANEKALELWDRTRGQVINTTILESFPELEAQGFIHILTKVYTTGQRYISPESPIKLFRNGKLQDAWINFVYEPLRDTAGNIYGIVGAGVEVTDQVEVRRKIQSSESKLRNMVASAPVAIRILKGPEFIVELCNNAYLEMAGRKEEGFIGMPLFTAMPELVEQGFKEILTKVYTTGEPYYGNEAVSEYIRFGKKEKRYFNFVHHPVYENDGNNVSGIITVINDITAQVEARCEIEENSRQFQNLVMKSPIAMAIFRGEENIIELANDSLVKKIWKKNFNDIRGKKLLDVIPELAQQQFPALLKQVFETGIACSGSEAMVFHEEDGELKKYYVDFEYAPLFETEGKVSGIMVTSIDVTEKVEARNKIEEAETRLRFADEAARLGTFDWDLVNESFDQSTRLTEIFGLTYHPNITHKNLLDVFHPEDIGIRNEAIKKSYEKGSLDYEARVIWPDASVHWIRVFGKVFFDNQRPLRMYGTVQDITNERQSLSLLQESEERLRLANDAARLGTFDWEIKNEKFNHSQRLAEIFGFERYAVLTREDILRVFPPADLNTRNRALKSSFENGSLNYEASVVWPDASVHWIKVYGKMIYGDDKAPLRMYGTVQDVTSEKESLKLLQESEERLRIATDAAELGTWDLHLHDDKIFHSARQAKIFGYEEGKALTHVELRSHVHPDDYKTVINAFSEAIISGTLSYEVRIVWKDGSVHWIRSHGKIIYDEKHAPVRMLGIVMDITRQKEALKELQESEERQRLATQTASLGTFDLDLVADNVIFSNRYLQIFGYKPGITWGREAFYRHLHPEDVELARREFQRSLVTGSLNYTARVVWQDKSIHWVKKNGKVFYDDNGVPVRIIGTLMDITERKSIEAELERKVAERTAELKNSEERNYRMVNEIEDYAILRLNKEGNIENWNKGAEKIKGYREDEIIGKNFSIFYSDEDRSNRLPEKLIKQASLTGKAITEGWRIRKDGSRFWASIVITSLHDKEGNVIGFSKITRDLTERKISQEKLEQHTLDLIVKNRELQQQKEFVDAILESSVDAICVFDTEGRYIAANRRCEEMYNVTKNYLIGKKVADAFTDEKTVVFRQNITKALKGESIYNLFYKSPVTGRIYETFYIPLKQDGLVYAVLVVAHDNTDIFDASQKLEAANKTLEEQAANLKKSNVALEKSNAELEQYAYIASHDLQEPLRKIRTYSSMLNDRIKGIADAASLTTLQKVIDSATRMSSLIYDLLNFSRLLNPERTFEQTDLNILFKNITSDFELTIEQKKATVVAKPLPVIDAVPLQMNQLFYNLLNNALKFSRENIPPVITVDARQMSTSEVAENNNLLTEETYFDITVCDNGIGFSQQYASQIFEIFKRLHAKWEYQGSGIGLALCRRITVNHHGDIYAEGKENEGSVFHVILPFKQPK